MVWIFTKNCDLVMDFCAVTFFEARACMLLDLHRKSVGCDVDPEALSAAELDFLLINDSHMLN